MAFTITRRPPADDFTVELAVAQTVGQWIRRGLVTRLLVIPWAGDHGGHPWIEVFRSVDGSFRFGQIRISWIRNDDDKRMLDIVVKATGDVVTQVRIDDILSDVSLVSR